jgi:5-methylcytosine-specific restriction endonuclease McrA
MDSWLPIEGNSKVRRKCVTKTTLSSKRADHRNAILKDLAKRLETSVEPKVPLNYKHPFEKKKCIYCLSSKIGPAGDEFRPISQRGRINKVNCVPCCGTCNSSKQDKCGLDLVDWIKKKASPAQFEKIMNWYMEHEKYMLIPPDTVDIKHGKTYSELVDVWIDEQLNKMYELFA